MKKNRWRFVFETKQKRGFVQVLVTLAVSGLLLASVALMALAMSSSLFRSCEKPKLFDVTCTSIAQARKEGVYLAAYQVVPQQLTVGEDTLIELQECFVQRRVVVNINTADAEELEADVTHPRLVMVLRDSAASRLAGEDCDLEVLSEGMLEPGQGQVFANHAAFNVLAINLKRVEKFLPKTVVMRMTIRDAEGQERKFVLKATPLD